MNSKIRLALLALLISPATMATDFSKPEDAVGSYITGVSTGSGEHVMDAFSETAKIQYYNDSGEFRDYTRDAFAKLVDSGDDWDAKIEITRMLRTANAANATVEFTWGENGQHGYVDYLNLIYADGSWRIASKVAQYVDRSE